MGVASNSGNPAIQRLLHPVTDDAIEQAPQVVRPRLLGSDEPSHNNQPQPAGDWALVKGWVIAYRRQQRYSSSRL
jgi:hypothetical protein